MAKYEIQVQCLSTATYLIEADSAEEAEDIALNGPCGDPEDVIEGGYEVVSTINLDEAE